MEFFMVKGSEDAWEYAMDTKYATVSKAMQV